MRRLRLLILMLLPAVLLTLGACQTIPRPAFDAADLAAASPPWRYDFLTADARDRFVRETVRAQNAATTSWPCQAAEPTAPMALASWSAGARPAPGPSSRW